MTARLAGYLSGNSPEQNIALILTEFGIYDARPPAELAEALNVVVLKEMQTENYFTLAYADVDLISGQVQMVQAGHPHPAVIRADGRVEYLGTGGLPVGLLDGATYDGFETRLLPGDQLFLMSDGITEAADTRGAELGQDGLSRIIGQCAGLRGAAFLEGLCQHLTSFTNGNSAMMCRGSILNLTVLRPTSAEPLWQEFKDRAAPAAENTHPRHCRRSWPRCAH
jgi:sigma-B regulation protein RsbU (phosphoserine phosphatase)